MPQFIWHNVREVFMAALTEQVGIWLGRQVHTEFDVAQAVRQRLPLIVLTALIKEGLTKDEFHSIVIPLRTFKHRKSRVEPLSIEESDRALRAARVLALAQRVFANREKAMSWMRKPKKRFENETPMQMLQTEVGARLVEQMLIQVDEGMFA